MPSATLVLDLAAFDDGPSAELARRWVEAARYWGMDTVVIALEQGRVAQELSEVPCSVVPARYPTRRGLNWSIALQSVTSQRAVLVTGPADPLLGWHEPATSVVELVSLTDVLLRVHGLGIDVADYTRVRGFDNALADPLDLIADLVNRVRAATGGAPAVGRWAFRHAQGTYLRNLPAWPWRPVGAPASVTVLIVAAQASSRLDESVLAAQAQYLDDIEICIADLSGEAMDDQWVTEHSAPRLPRFGGYDAITRHDLSGNQEEGWRSLIASLRSDWTLVVGADELALPWAVSSMLQHLDPHVRAVAGLRVPFDDRGDVRPEIDVALPRAALLSTSLLHEWECRPVADARELTAELLEGVQKQESPWAVSVTPVAFGEAGSARWRTPWTVEPVGAARACLPDRFGAKSMILRQLCVAKLDELRAFDRIHTILAELNDSGALAHEVCVVQETSWWDYAYLARGGHTFEGRMLPPHQVAHDERIAAEGRRAASEGEVVCRSTEEPLIRVDQAVRHA